MATVEVTSDQNAEVVYRVDTEAHTCTCPQYTQRLARLNDNLPADEWVYCKHIKRVLDQERRACAS